MATSRKSRCAGPAAHFGEQEVHTKFYLENFKHRNHNQKPKFMRVCVCVCVCVCARACPHACVYEGMKLNCTIKKLVVKMGSVLWI